MHNPNRVTFYRGRTTVNGRKVRPRCPFCDRAVGQKWLACRGCNAQIQWVGFTLSGSLIKEVVVVKPTEQSSITPEDQLEPEDKATLDPEKMHNITQTDEEEE